MNDQKIKVAINGLGRIGRAFLKTAWDREEIEIVAINDLADLDNLAYLLKYDTAYGAWDKKVEIVNGDLRIEDRVIKSFQEKDPGQLPWRQLGVRVVVESTGVFATYEKSKVHLDAGAVKVVVSAPVKGEPLPGIKSGTFLMGINDGDLSSCQISSNASCTTNAASPLIQILHEKIGIKKALLNTVHGYTATQRLVDSPDGKDWRRGRAGAQNIIPSTTGAATAVTQVITELEGKFDGIATRVPVITGSLVDVTFLTTRSTNAEEVNNILSESASEDRWKKVFTVTTEPLVSSDIIGSPYASIADLSFTKVVDGDLVKVMAWYDNEIGYASTLVEHVIATGK